MSYRHVIYLYVRIKRRAITDFETKLTAPTRSIAYCDMFLLSTTSRKLWFGFEWNANDCVCEMVKQPLENHRSQVLFSNLYVAVCKQFGPLK
ncbi:hypothetical protein ACU8KH_04963 [Lachancea thermotolerans]